jgi:aspartyl-tRNA synthetase
MYRDHTCGELRKTDIDKEVKLAGWVQSRRDHGGLIFIDLRDRYGLTQIVFDPNVSKEMHAEAEKLRREDVIAVSGKVRSRKPGMANPKLATGDIEVIVSKVDVLSKA